MMIGNYREVIAADYAFTFLNQFLNVALSALMKQHLLNDEQKEIANLQREDVHKFMTRLQQEQATHVQEGDFGLDGGHRPRATRAQPPGQHVPRTFSTCSATPTAFASQLDRALRGHGHVGDLRLSQHGGASRHLQRDRRDHGLQHLPERHRCGRVLRVRRGHDRLHVPAREASGWKWLITVVLVLRRAVRAQRDRGIVDKTGGTPNRIIANVPFGMAALGGLTSTIGNTITELFETAFQVPLPDPAALPAELAYQQNGLMFGSRLIQETRRTPSLTPQCRTDLVNFVSNCTAYDIADGTISPTAFSTSADLWTTMGATNPARFSIITTATGVTTNTCDAVYTVDQRSSPGADQRTSPLASVSV
jgi:hypothetical protein